MAAGCRSATQVAAPSFMTLQDVGPRNLSRQTCHSRAPTPACLPKMIRLDLLPNGEIHDIDVALKIVEGGDGFYAIRYDGGWFDLEENIDNEVTTVIRGIGMPDLSRTYRLNGLELTEAGDGLDAAKHLQAMVQEGSQPSLRRAVARPESLRGSTRLTRPLSSFRPVAARRAPLTAVHELRRERRTRGLRLSSGIRRLRRSRRVDVATT